MALPRVRLLQVCGTHEEHDPYMHDPADNWDINDA